MKEMLSCFKAYDIRGKVPEELNEDLAEKIGRAYSAVFNVKKVAVGRDMRLSGEGLAQSLTKGLLESGVDVVDLGLCGTEEIYHAAFSMEKDGIDGAIIVTASHNPADYNGMKFVVRGARPVTGDTGLQEMQQRIADNDLPPKAETPGSYSSTNNKDAYIKHLLSYVDVASLKPFTIVTNGGNGCAGTVLDLLEQHLPFIFIKLNNEPDGTFPKGVPNPLLPEKREETAQAVREHGADLGVAWDGDFDRCFFWDENGEFVEGYYVVGMLAKAMLKTYPGGKILYDPRLTWNTEEIVAEAGGRAIMTKTGHAFIKERMRKENALYGGEMSAHHYFRDFGYCDSGMIPWLLVASLLSAEEASLSSMVEEMITAHPVSGEINSTVNDPDAILSMVQQVYGDGELDFTDGVSVNYDEYRFNIRKSNTEPLLRLNVESRADRMLMEMKTQELLTLISSM